MGLCRRVLHQRPSVIQFPRMGRLQFWSFSWHLSSTGNFVKTFPRTPPVRRKASACSATITVAPANVQGNVKLNDLPSHITLRIMSFMSMCQAGHACVLCCQISGVPCPA